MSAIKRLLLSLVVLATVLALPAAASSASVSARVATSSCTVANFGQLAGTPATHPFTLAKCENGWGLATGSSGSTLELGLFKTKNGAYTKVATLGPNGLGGQSPLQFLGSGISARLLEELAQTFPLSAQQVVDAGALVVALGAHETSIGATDSVNASAVVSIKGRTWFVVAGADAATSSDSNANANPYPSGTMTVYQWSSGTWTKSGSASGDVGPVGGCCSIDPATLTGSRDPDFAMTGGGAADTVWLSIISDVTGKWQLVPFDYGYSDTTVVNGDTYKNGVATNVDATSSALGPTTETFETYQDGVFRPANEPEGEPTCSASALESAANLGELQLIQFTKFSCADGWALAIGSGAGYTGNVVGLFVADKSNWTTLELDNGNSLGSDPAIYDIPLTLLRQLTRSFGTSVQPALATAPLIAGPILGAQVYTNGIDLIDGSTWFVAEKPTGSGDSASANATIYRWSGSAWTKQGEVDHVPNSLDYFEVGAGWFQAVSLAGVSEPGFMMNGGTSGNSEVLSDAGGNWHAAAYTTN